MDVVGLQRLQEVVARATEATSAAGVARVLVEEGVAVLGAAMGGFWMLEDDHLALLHASGGVPGESFQRLPIDGDAPLAACVRECEPIWLGSADDYATRFPASLARIGAQIGCACLPLVVEGRAIGGAVFAFQGSRTFTDIERTSLVLIARQCAHALDRIRLVDAQRAARRDAEQLAQRMTALQAVAARLAAARGFAETKRIVIDDCRQALGAAGAGLWLVDGEAAVLVAHGGLAASIVQGMNRVPLADGGPLAGTLRTRKPLWLDSQVAVAAGYSVVEGRWTGVEAVAIVPLVAEGQLLGAYGIAFDRPRTFDVGDREFLELYAVHAAQAIERIRLVDAAEQLARRMAALYELSVALSSARTPDEVASATTRLGCEATGAASGMIWLRDGDGALRLLGTNATPEWSGEWAVLTRDPALPANRVLADGEPIWVESVQDYEREASLVLERVQRAGRVQPFVALPLNLGGERAGVISFSFAGSHHFDSDERTFVQAIARSCEQALDRAQLYSTEAGARTAAESASRAKDEFLAMLGHELRNPLAPIVTALDLMRMRNVGEGMRERAIIERQVTHLTRLVDDLLDISRITRGKIELRRTTDELIRAVEPAIDAVGPLVFQHRHQLSVDVPATGLCVDGDPARLSQIVRNLLANAAKFTHEGGQLRIAARSIGSCVELTVADNGRGIAPALLPHVFEPFVQGSQGAERAGGGLGLGLAIVKSLVELHGGSVAVTSAGPGLGTTVTVQLPRVPGMQPAANTHSSARAAVRSLRVLVVDDNVDAAALLGDLLRCLGHEPVIVHDGPAALAAVDRDPPQLAILDIGLPGMDGYELARRLREHPNLAGVAVVALTGYGQPSDRQRTRDAGFAEHLVKPIDLQRLDELVGRFTLD